MGSAQVLIFVPRAEFTWGRSAGLPAVQVSLIVSVTDVHGHTPHLCYHLRNSDWSLMAGLSLNAMKDGSTTMATIYLVEGPVGAGKSTFVAELRSLHTAAGFILDAWFVRLYSPDRPAANLMEWYAARKARCMAQIWITACEVLDTGRDVVLELGLVERASRESFYAQVRRRATIWPCISWMPHVTFVVIASASAIARKAQRFPWMCRMPSLSWRATIGSPWTKPSARSTMSR